MPPEPTRQSRSAAGPAGWTPAAAVFRVLRALVGIGSVAGFLLGLAGALFAIGMGGFHAGPSRPSVVLELFAPLPLFAGTFASALLVRRRGVHLLVAIVVVLASAWVLRVAWAGPDRSFGFALLGFLALWLVTLLHRVVDTSR